MGDFRNRKWRLPTWMICCAVLLIVVAISSTPANGAKKLQASVFKPATDGWDTLGVGFPSCSAWAEIDTSTLEVYVHSRVIFQRCSFINCESCGYFTLMVGDFAQLALPDTLPDTLRIRCEVNVIDSVDGFAWTAFCLTRDGDTVCGEYPIAIEFGDSITLFANYDVSKDSLVGVGQFEQYELGFKLDIRGTPYCTIIDDVSEVSAYPVPTSHRLLQNYPNPFNPETTIEFEVPRAGLVEVEIVDLLGRHVALLCNQVLGPGRFRTYWNGRASDGTALPSAVYFCRMRAGEKSLTRKLVLVK